MRLTVRNDWIEYLYILKEIENEIPMGSAIVTDSMTVITWDRLYSNVVEEGKVGEDKEKPELIFCALFHALAYILAPPVGGI